MKIQGAKKVHYDAGPNMTPLVDVVMVILIFLMLRPEPPSASRHTPPGVVRHVPAVPAQK